LSAYSEIVEELQTLRDWRLELFATGCAQRVRPLVDACGSAETVTLYQQGLDASWVGIGDGDFRAEQGQRLAAELESGPESEAESSAERGYYGMGPITILAPVLRSLAGDQTVDIGQRACAQALNMLADVDYTLQPSDERPRIIDPRQPPAVGPLEQDEIAAQRDSIALLREAGSAAEAVTTLRSRAEEDAVRLAASMPQFLARGEFVD
jgi:hypothetical protein